MTKISDIGEFGFIDAIKEHTLFHPENVAVGIGDDGAVYTTTPGWQQVAVIDTMVQNSHFIIGQTATWHDVGFKAVASNLSAIAAIARRHNIISVTDNTFASPALQHPLADGADVVVYDAGGREVYASRDGAEKQMVVLPSGVYVVKVGYKVVKVMK